MNPAVSAYSVVCDKTQTDKSLVHAIAKRAGLTANDIDCSTIPIELPYVKLSKNIWAELSSLAAAYRCHLECAIEKPLVFVHSPYQAEPLLDDDYSYTFTGKDIFYLRIIEKAELYKNSVRLKINLPIVLEKQEIWSYDDAPVLYDEELQKYYPFRNSSLREIETEKYEARYRIIENGKERAVVFADEVDSQEEAENRLDFDDGDFTYSHYDISTHKDRAILTLTRNGEGDLNKACIHGKPIVLDLNRSCFLHDADGIENHGTAALNITGFYFSEQEVHGKPQYEDWVIRELAERMKARREFTVKTHRALFNARVGAKVHIETIKENNSGVIQEFSFVYKKDSAFVSTFKLLEI
jgi:hypothetical protein